MTSSGSSLIVGNPDFPPWTFRVALLDSLLINAERACRRQDKHQRGITLSRGAVALSRGEPFSFLSLAHCRAAHLDPPGGIRNGYLPASSIPDFSAASFPHRRTGSPGEVSAGGGGHFHLCQSCRSDGSGFIGDGENNGAGGGRPRVNHRRRGRGGLLSGNDGHPGLHERATDENAGREGDEKFHGMGGKKEKEAGSGEAFCSNRAVGAPHRFLPEKTFCVPSQTLRSTAICTIRANLSAVCHRSIPHRA